MSHAHRSHAGPRPHLCLLDLVGAVSEVARDDREVVAVVRHLMESGRVRLGAPGRPPADPTG